MQLRADTEIVALTGKKAEKNRAGLLGKLDNASTALAKGKLCGAIRKLTDFRNKVNQLIASGSINNDPTVGVTGQDLVDGANEAIACIQAQVAQSGTTCPVLSKQIARLEFRQSTWGVSRRATATNLPQYIAFRRSIVAGDPPWPPHSSLLSGSSIL